MDIDRDEWLTSLKGGDQVVVHRGVWAGPTIDAVKRRLSSGGFVLSNGDRYNKRGHDTDGRHLEPVTPKILAEIEHRELVSEVNGLISRLNNVNVVKKLSNDVLRNIAVTLKKYIEEI